MIQRPLEQGYARSVLFAVELLDPVTLERVSDGVRITADGLSGRPTTNASGVFVWLGDDATTLQKITVDPGVLPYDRFERLKADLNLTRPRPLTTIELPPRVDYPVSGGVTALRGSLHDDLGSGVVAVSDASIRLRWLDEDGATWRDAPVVSRTNARGGFLAMLRLTASEVPKVDAAGQITLRVLARRGGSERSSIDITVPYGRVSDPSAVSALKLVWDDLQP